MAFTKGTSGNPHGREKGSLNKATAAAKERIEQVLCDLDTTLTVDLKALSPQQRVEMWAKLQEYIRPKLSRTAVTADERPAKVVIRIGGKRPEEHRAHYAALASENE